MAAAISDKMICPDDRVPLSKQSKLELGKADVPQEIVDAAVKYLADLWNKGDDELANNLRLSYPITYHPHDHSKLNDSPVGKLMSLLICRISALGISCLQAELVFELGVFRPNAPVWHLDGRINGQNGITICFSNKKDWSTRIVDQEIAKKLLHIKNDPYSFDLLGKLHDAGPEVTKKLEAKSRPSKIGYFYDACIIPHRSPMASDFPEQERVLKPADYRLFIRVDGNPKL